MSKNPLAVVCALAFAVGAVAAVALHYPPRDGAVVRGVAENSADGGGPNGAASAETGSPDKGAHAEDVATATETAGAAGVGGGEGSKTAAAVRRRATAGARDGKGPRAAPGYVRVSGGRADTGGRGVAGHAVGGVKKTGQGVKKAGTAIGKTFGKIGGVFHD